jgi:ribosomal protein S3
MDWDQDEAARGEVLKAIASFYLQKHEDKPAAEAVSKAEQDIRDLMITKITVLPSESIVVIRLERPGLLVGKCGTNIDALEKFLNAEVRIVEANSVTSEILMHLPYDPECLNSD